MHCRRGEDLLLGDGDAAHDGRHGIQRLRSHVDVRQLSDQRRRQRPSRSAARLSGRHRLQHEPRHEVGDAGGRLDETKTTEEAIGRFGPLFIY